MIVEQIMTKDVITLSPEDSIRTAIHLMREKNIRHLPLLNSEKKMIGLVTDRDIKSATPVFSESDKLHEQLEMPLSTIMTTNIITGHPLDFVEEVAVIFYDHKIGCLPILQNGELVGIITGTDLLHTLVELTGANKPGSQIEVKVENRPGVLHEVTGIFQKFKVNVHSVLVYPAQDNENAKILVFRVATMNPLLVIENLKKEGLQVMWPNSPGMKA
ncbi:acetoin utilization AcuB family protein [Lederbergia wuyishanensis]|uniref:Acetoin utilization protein AcuB n=1 Tax=Lederbergia wuyishanensis TaxID=1347903 RepID=A0ABU0D507_9BACI|nr:acetoin utilization AcuB family protein [Lederbergia wuyishanensis]MCJ8009587.1 acetoin utilization AcuB family protein [Lederbergia wuyishanensis]MDQ0343493.1 acetoin utilization protein AcuB [Lederbergia wuyishanensis]